MNDQTHREWLEWLKVAPMTQLEQSLGVRERLYYSPSAASERKEIREEIETIREEMRRRNGK